jgi:capsular exopolysaccharide synthesis family protein
MEDQLQPQNNEQGVFNIKDLFYKYVRFLPLFIISIALGLFVSYIFLRYSTLYYSSTGSLVVQDESSSPRGNDKLDQLFESDAKKNIQNEIEYLQSRQMMARVVRSLDLNFTYLAKGKIKELNIYKQNPFRIEAFKITDSVPFTLNIDFENQHNFRVNGSAQPFTFGQVFENESGVFRVLRNPEGVIGKEYKLVWQPTNTVAGSLTSGLTIAPKQGTGILTVRHESTSADLSSDVVNQLMNEYQKATIDDKNLQTQNRLNFIDRELDTVARQVDSITRIRQNYIKKYRAYDLSTQSMNNLARIEEADKDRALQQNMLGNVYQIENYLLDPSNNNPVPSSLRLEDPTLNKMVDAYNQAQIERKMMLQTAPPGNIAVKQKTEAIEKLRKNILESLKNVKQSYNTVISSLRQQSAMAQAELSLMPEQQQALTEINRQLEGKLDIYKSLLVKREETAIQLASTISDIKVLQEASPNYAPIKPNRRSVQLMGALIGLLIPGLFIFALELLNDKVTTRFDVERLTGAAVIGEVGHSYSNDTLVVTSNNRGVVAEQFRIIRSNLQYVINHIAKPVILVTSSFSGEGKSFVSTNVGAVMALAGKRTIVLEFDIRKPKILSQLHIPKKAGLTNYVLGKIKLEDLPIQVEGYDNLFVLACGPVPPNPSELLLDKKIDELFEYLREAFDVVIVDTAPVGMVSDAMTLSKYADSTLYIVRQGHTFKKQVSLIDEFYREGKLPKISIVLNDVKLRTGYGYYGYGRYGYGHGYGSGYYEEEATPPSTLQKWFGWMSMKKSKRNSKQKV